MQSKKKKELLGLTALYCRLSREDGDRMESDSIGNQRKLLESYIENHSELVMAECYADDGYTGTNFQRPAFQRMLRDIGNGRIRCVLVKDLSRFGRDYIETGRYLERWLPEHGVRFIAITDNIDSVRGAYDMMMPLKNLFNTQYARDISQKVKSSLHAKQQRGEFIPHKGPHRRVSAVLQRLQAAPEFGLKDFRLEDGAVSHRRAERRVELLFRRSLLIEFVQPGLAQYGGGQRPCVRHAGSASGVHDVLDAQIRVQQIE